jgi:hypothetical protein
MYGRHKALIRRSCLYSQNGLQVGAGKGRRWDTRHRSEVIISSADPRRQHSPSEAYEALHHAMHIQPACCSEYSCNAGLPRSMQPRIRVSSQQANEPLPRAPQSPPSMAVVSAILCAIEAFLLLVCAICEGFRAFRGRRSVSIGERGWGCGGALRRLPK